MKKNFQTLYNLLLEEKPELSDAIIWLQGDRYDRATKVIQAFKLKFAKLIVICGNNILIGSKIRPGENNISLSEMKNYLVKNGINKDYIIIEDKAFNTKDQAKCVSQLAKKGKWKKLILVSSAYNQPRALLTFLKQIKDNNLNIKVYNYPVIKSFGKVPGGRNESVEKLCLSEIEKIEKYKDDLLPILFGIKYIKSKNL